MAAIPADAGAAGSDRTGKSLASEARALIDALRDALAARAQLFALEARRAGLALTEMLMFGVLAATLVLTAWLGLAALVVVLLMYAGMNPAFALLVMVLLNLTGAWAMVARLRQLAAHLGFPATLRRLRPASTSEGGAPVPSVRPAPQPVPQTQEP